MVDIDTHLTREASNGGATFHNQGGPYGRTNGAKRIVCVDVTGLPLCVRVVPTSGAAFVAGIDVRKHPALVKQVSGIVSQQNTLDRQLTVWENLYFHGRLFGVNPKESRRRADELLDRFSLSKWAKASVHVLSGGMAQRLMVARAIFHRPAVLFLDKPTAGLDPKSRLALWDMLGELNQTGQTVVLTTHYMEEADALCARVAIMDHGKIIALDTPANLKKSTGVDTIVTIKVRDDRILHRVPVAGSSKLSSPRAVVKLTSNV
jgi:ABC-2 type transport system ATP-binding protein